MCPNTNNAGESPFLKPSECPDQIPSAEQNLIFFFIYTHTHTHAQRIISLLNHNTFGHLSLASNHTFIQLSLYPKAHYLLVLPPRIIAVKSTLLFAIIDTLLFFSTRSFSFKFDNYWLPWQRQIPPQPFPRWNQNSVLHTEAFPLQTSQYWSNKDRRVKFLFLVFTGSEIYLMNFLRIIRLGKILKLNLPCRIFFRQNCLETTSGR